jgi:cytochrome c oxidase cbb3-type subunit 3
MNMRFALVLLLSVSLVAACEREKREPRAKPVAAEQPQAVTLGHLRPGGGAPPPPPPPVAQADDQNAYQISEGKRLFQWYNCSGCHANGGGGMGPPLIDDTWIYGSEPQNIFQTIREGRPNGMPSFRGKIPDEQIWQLVAYVRSMGRFTPKAAASGRSDDMSARPSEQRLPKTQPKASGTPPSAERPM